MNNSIKDYNNSQSAEDKKICQSLCEIINQSLVNSESKIWHSHPVWFLDGNPIVGYSKLKDGVRLMFWSGIDFNEPFLTPGTGKFKDASITYTDAAQINQSDIKSALKKSEKIQWDYKNIVKRKGQLIRIK